MQMKRKLKEERASMAVYVAIALTSFLIILVSLYTTSVSVRKAQLSTIIKIKEAYEQDNAKIEEDLNQWGLCSVNKRKDDRIRKVER